MSAPESGGELIPDEAFDGAGIVSSIHDMVSAAEKQDAEGIVAATAVAALDALDFVDDPLTSLAAAGVGWAMEHVWFLREPLDALCGDAKEIEDRATSWERLSRELAARSEVLGRTVAATGSTWTGDAADGYRTSAEPEADGLHDLSGQVRDIAELVLSSGVMVGTERSIIRDLIADFIVWLVPKLFAAASATVASVGIAGPAAVALVVLDAVDFARKLLKRIGELSDELARMAQLAERIASNLQAGTPVAAVDAAAGMAAVGRVGDAAVSPAQQLRDGALELDKQASSARATQAEWDAQARAAS